MTTDLVAPHRRQRIRQILRVIANYWQDHGYAPSVRDIARGSGDSTTSTVARWLMIMEGDGLIDSAPDRARTIRLTAKGEEMLAR